MKGVSDMSGGNGSPRPRHYIVVVHGMGEQRHNENTVEVVNRFATARANPKPEFAYAALLPGSLSSLSMRQNGRGHGWSEFEGIPVDPRSNSAAFDGTRAATTAGKNFRFVDMRWADILHEHQRVFGSQTKHWTGSLLARLELPFTPRDWSDRWVRPLLEQIEDTLLPIEWLLKWYSPPTAKRIFQDVFGDVHLYGDYARTRGQAVRRFHAQLDQIHLRDYIQWCQFERTSKDEPYVPPVYTIIAHSLGSVLSFDALLYAFAKETIRNGNNGSHRSGSIPFAGYTEAEPYESISWRNLLSELMKNPSDSKSPSAAENWEEFGCRYPQFKSRHGAALPTRSPRGVNEIPLLLWRGQVRNFVSLGSPIDKFLTLWHHNYRHVGLGYPFCDSKWCEDWLDEPTTGRIAHFNLCDEQDPVGHHLDVARSCKVYSQVFQTDIPVKFRDIVFRRYAVPGLAHVQYWEDQRLFDLIIEEVIDKPSQPSTNGRQVNWVHLEKFVKEDFVNAEGVYEMALVWAYARMPLIASVITGLLLSYGWIGWRYWGFSPSCALALLAGMLLWSCPRPFELYGQEAKTEYVRRKNCWTKRLVPWKPRYGILANFVAGSVAWRRILILLNEPTQRSCRGSGDSNDNVRLFLETAGNFRPLFLKRIVGGGILLAVIAAVTWYMETHECMTIGIKGEPPVWYVATLVALTVTVVYLLVMIYVAYIFTTMKKRLSIR